MINTWRQLHNGSYFTLFRALQGSLISFKIWIVPFRPIAGWIGQLAEKKGAGSCCCHCSTRSLWSLLKPGKDLKGQKKHKKKHTVLCLTLVKLHRTWWLAGRRKQASISSRGWRQNLIGVKNKNRFLISFFYLQILSISLHGYVK